MRDITTETSTTTDSSRVLATVARSLRKPAPLAIVPAEYGYADAALYPYDWRTAITSDDETTVSVYGDDYDAWENAVWQEARADAIYQVTSRTTTQCDYCTAPAIVIRDYDGAALCPACS